MPARADTWVTTRTGSFIVYTNTSAARAVQTAETLERMRAAVALATTLDATIDRPIRVFVFRSTRDYLRYGRELVGTEPQKDGLSIIHPVARAILIDAATLRTDALLQHELAHHLVRQTYRNLPLWLDEGLAELYSTVRVRGEVVHIGRARDVHRRLMRRAMIPMRELVTADTKSHWYAQPFLESRFYAQSWLFTHWLVVERRVDVQFVADTFTGHGGETAIRTLLQMTPHQLQRTLFRYNLRPDLPSREVRITRLDVATPAAPRAMTEGEIRRMFVW